MSPITKFEMNRMVHARAQELHLTGSPAGQSGHPQLSRTATHIYGVSSFSDLNVDQMRAIYEYLDKHRRLPLRGEL